MIIAAAVAAPLQPLGAARRLDCTNKHSPDSDCATWAASGECDKNPGFMKIECAKTCKSCGWEDTACTDRSHLQPAKRNGDIHSTFENALELGKEFGPRVHSRPPDGPWIITFDNFVSDDEADAFISTTDHHFQRSLAGDMVSPVRTSQQAWCQYGIAPDSWTTRW